MLKKLTSLFLLIISCLLVQPSWANPQSTTYFQSYVENVKPQLKEMSFVDVVENYYYLIFASQININTYYASAEKINELFFTTDLFNQVQKGIKISADYSKKLNDVGCLNDFDIATGLQEKPHGFYVSQLNSTDNKALIQVSFIFSDSKGKIITDNKNIALIKTNEGWKIDNIIYTPGKNGYHPSIRDIYQTECQKNQQALLAKP